MLQDNVVKYLIRACLAVTETDPCGRMKNECLRIQLKRVGFRYLGHGSGRICVQHIRTRRVFKVSRWIDKFDYAVDNETEWERYYGKFKPEHLRYFAKPIALYWRGRILETTLAQGVLASEIKGCEYEQIAKPIIKELKNEYDLVDLHHQNFFVHDNSVTIVDYAI